MIICTSGCGSRRGFGAFLSPRLGASTKARPLKRAVQEQLLNPLSMKLLEGEFKPGDRIKVSTNDGELIFKTK